MVQGAVGAVVPLVLVIVGRGKCCHGGVLSGC